MDKRCPVCQVSFRVRLGASSASCPQCKTRLLYNEHPSEVSSLNSFPELAFIVVGLAAVGLAYMAGLKDLGIALTVVGVGMAFLAWHFRGVALRIPDDWPRWKVASPSPSLVKPSSDETRKPE